MLNNSENTMNNKDSIKSYLIDLTNDSINSTCDSLDIIRENTLDLLNYLNPSYYPHYIRTIVNKSDNSFSIVFDYIYEHDDFELFISDSVITLNYYFYSQSTNNVSLYSKKFLISDSNSITFISEDNFNSLSIPITKSLFLNNINSHNIKSFQPIVSSSIPNIATIINSIFSSNDNNSNIISSFNLNLINDN